MRLHRTIRMAILAGSTLVGSTLAVASCAWSRFDDLKDSVPVVEIESPGGIPGFGTTMTTVAYGGNTRLMVLGEPNLAPKGAAYDIVNDDPSSSPVRSGFCESGRCLFGSTPTPLKSMVIDGVPHDACFVLGVGDRNKSLGLVGSCADGTDFVLPVAGKDARFPNIKTEQDVIGEDLAASALGRLLIGDFKYGASDEDQPLLAAASKYLGASWYYPPGSSSPVAITPIFPPDDPDAEPPVDPRLKLGDSFGSAVAVASVAQGGQLIAISSPLGVGEQDTNRTESAVWLYRVIDGKIVHDGPNPEVAAPVGCIPGFSRNFGKFLHATRLFGGPSQELMISDGTTLSIYDAGKLAENPPSTACAGPPLGVSGYLTSIQCVETGSVKGCSIATGGFGQSIAVGDVDGNGTNELVVGAPMLSVGGLASAGAVLVYEVDPTGANTRLLEAKIISSRDTRDALGASVATLRIGNRDVIAAGAPGLGSLFLFYCSDAGGAGASSSRCH